MPLCCPAPRIVPRSPPLRPKTGPNPKVLIRMWSVEEDTPAACGLPAFYMELMWMHHTI